MGKNELGKVFNMADRSCLFFHGFGQSHYKRTKTILIAHPNHCHPTSRICKYSFQYLHPMRSFLLHAIFFCIPYCAIAQLEDRSFAPDFELQDLNGNTWHLYELLESGKHVILDFSATWCAPCWWYHETGLLNEAYSLYGPDGTNELMVFMIETDDQTNVACLYDLPDCSHTTQGDWTAGTLYPIINDDPIADAYQIQGWPTHYYICPNKLIYNTSQPNHETIDYFMNSCAETVGQHNASIAAFTGYSVYPNPVDGALQVRFESKQTIPLTVSVFNSMGVSVHALPEAIFSSGAVNFTLDLSELSAGVYALH